MFEAYCSSFLRFSLTLGLTLSRVSELSSQILGIVISITSSAIVGLLFMLFILFFGPNGRPFESTSFAGRAHRAGRAGC